MEKYKNKYRIASARWQTWNYAWDAAYFITICTRGREYFFGNVVDGKMVLSNEGVIADILWYEIKNHAENIELGEFQVMPNHIHGILILNGNNVNNKNDDGDGDGYDNGNGNVETRHALSLRLPPPPQPPIQSDRSYPSDELNQSGKTIGQQRFQNQGKNTISSIVGGYKSAVSKHAHRLGFDFAWQSRFHDHIIRDEQEYQRIGEYIRNNPAKWNEDKFYR